MSLHLEHAALRTAAYDADASAERVRAIHVGAALDGLPKALPGATAATAAPTCGDHVDADMQSWATDLSGHAGALTSANASFAAMDQDRGDALHRAGGGQGDPTDAHLPLLPMPSLGSTPPFRSGLNP